MSNQVYANSEILYLQPTIDNIEAQLTTINGQITTINGQISSILPLLPNSPPISSTGTLTGPYAVPQTFTIKYVKQSNIIQLYWLGTFASSTVASFSIDTNAIIPLNVRPSFDFMFSCPITANNNFYNNGIVRIKADGTMSFALNPSGTQINTGASTGPLSGCVTYSLI